MKAKDTTSRTIAIAEKDLLNDKVSRNATNNMLIKPENAARLYQPPIGVVMGEKNVPNESMSAGRKNLAISYSANSKKEASTANTTDIIRRMLLAYSAAKKAKAAKNMRASVVSSSPPNPKNDALKDSDIKLEAIDMRTRAPRVISSGFLLKLNEPAFIASILQRMIPIEMSRASKPCFAKIKGIGKTGIKNIGKRNARAVSIPKIIVEMTDLFATPSPVGTDLPSA